MQKAGNTVRTRALPLSRSSPMMSALARAIGILRVTVPKPRKAAVSFTRVSLALAQRGRHEDPRHVAEHGQQRVDLGKCARDDAPDSSEVDLQGDLARSRTVRSRAQARSVFAQIAMHAVKCDAQLANDALRVHSGRCGRARTTASGLARRPAVRLTVGRHRRRRRRLEARVRPRTAASSVHAPGGVCVSAVAILRLGPPCGMEQILLRDGIILTWCPTGNQPQYL